MYVYGGGTAPLDEPELHFSQRGGERFGAARVVLRSGLSFHLSTARTWTFLPDGDPEPATVTTAADEMLTVTLTRCPGTAPC